MLPESKIHTSKTGTRNPESLFAADLRNSSTFKPQAISDYEKKKKEQREQVHKELQRIAMSDII